MPTLTKTPADPPPPAPAPSAAAVAAALGEEERRRRQRRSGGPTPAPSDGGPGAFELHFRSDAYVPPERKMSCVVMMAEDCLEGFDSQTVHPYSTLLTDPRIGGFRFRLTPTKTMLSQEIKRRNPWAKPNWSNRSLEELRRMLAPLTDPRDVAFVAKIERELREYLQSLLGEWERGGCEGRIDVEDWTPGCIEGMREGTTDDEEEAQAETRARGGMRTNSAKEVEKPVPTVAEEDAPSKPGTGEAKEAKRAHLGSTSAESRTVAAVALAEALPPNRRVGASAATMRGDADGDGDSDTSIGIEDAEPLSSVARATAMEHVAKHTVDPRGEFEIYFSDEENVPREMHMQYIVMMATDCMEGFDVETLFPYSLFMTERTLVGFKRNLRPVKWMMRQEILRRDPWSKPNANNIRVEQLAKRLMPLADSRDVEFVAEVESDLRRFLLKILEGWSANRKIGPMEPWVWEGRSNATSRESDGAALVTANVGVIGGSDAGLMPCEPVRAGLGFEKVEGATEGGNITCGIDVGTANSERATMSVRATIDSEGGTRKEGNKRSHDAASQEAGSISAGSEMPPSNSNRTAQQSEELSAGVLEADDASHSVAQVESPHMEDIYCSDECDEAPHTEDVECSDDAGKDLPGAFELYFSDVKQVPPNKQLQYLIMMATDCIEGENYKEICRWTPGLIIALPNLCLFIGTEGFDVSKVHPYSRFLSDPKFKGSGFKSLLRSTKELVAQEIRRRNPWARPNQSNKSLDELLELLEPLTDARDIAFVTKTEGELRHYLLKVLDDWTDNETIARDIRWRPRKEWKLLKKRVEEKERVATRQERIWRQPKEGKTATSASTPEMGIRVVEQTSFSFETDLPLLRRRVHRSGVIHAFRRNREEHAFGWIADSSHVGAALSTLKENGFDVSEGVAFIPYSTKKNWIERYPHAAPALECTKSGEILIYLNWRPYPNGLGEMGHNGDGGGRAPAADTEANSVDPDCVTADPESLPADSQVMNPDSDSEGREYVEGWSCNPDGIPKRVEKNGSKRKKEYKRRWRCRYGNMLRDKSLMHDRKRDELHVEIFVYLSWLEAKMTKILEQDQQNDGVAEEMDPDEKVDGAPQGAVKFVNVVELRAALDKLKLAFAVVPYLKLEEDGLEECDHNMGGEGQLRRIPFLEEALGDALEKLVEARTTLGSRGRTRTWKRRKKLRPKRPYIRRDFDGMFERLREYKEEHGECHVTKNLNADREVSLRFRFRLC
ncbi:hypothetical protein ACHAWF_012313 [Thalassiosira exigua]